MHFQLESEYLPRGDQPRAIDEMAANLAQGVPSQVLLGATGTGKTFSMAQVVSRLNRPALVMAPNKTLAAQLYSEFKGLFPNIPVESINPQDYGLVRGENVLNHAIELAGK